MTASSQRGPAPSGPGLPLAPCSLPDQGLNVAFHTVSCESRVYGGVWWRFCRATPPKGVKAQEGARTAGTHVPSCVGPGYQKEVRGFGQFLNLPLSKCFYFF